MMGNKETLPSTLKAIKVIGLLEWLTPSERRVGICLLEHFNRKSGRCDPSVGRIARLLNISGRTVMRATEKLHTHGLFIKLRHGGFSHRNAYRPNWKKFDELEEAWNAQKKISHYLSLPPASPSAGPTCQAAGDTDVAQTSGVNRTDLTCNERPAFKGKTSPRRFGQESSKEASYSAAERRWNDALIAEFRSKPVSYAEIIESITPGIQAGATDAEMRWRGAGLHYVLEALGLPRRAGDAS